MVIDPIARKASASEMVDKNIPGDHIAVSGKFRPEAKVVIFKIPRPQAFIQEANPIHQFPPEEHAKPDDSPKGNAPVAVLFPERPGIFIQSFQGPVSYLLHLLDPAGLVRHRPHDSNISCILKAFQKTGQPVLGNHDIWIQEY
jgi:hypothetical protein